MSNAEEVERMPTSINDSQITAVLAVVGIGVWGATEYQRLCDSAAMNSSHFLIDTEMRLKTHERGISAISGNLVGTPALPASAHRLPIHRIDGLLMAMNSSDERARWLARNVLPHEGALRGWLSKRPVAGLEIDDIVQETYARLSTMASVEEIRDPRNYMFRAAHSVILTYVRRSRVVPMLSFAQFEGEDFVDDVPGPETIAANREELSLLARAIAELPPRMREVFVLRRVEGLSQRQVAERLSLSESTVEKHMGSGFRRIADIFGRGGKEVRGASKDDGLGKGSDATRDKRRD